MLQDEPTVIKIRAPVKIFGDIHGQYSDLMRLFALCGAPNDLPGEGDIENFDYLFLGNYLGRGIHCLEVLFLILAIKCRHPKQIHLLRGHYDHLKFAGYLKQEC